MRGGGIQLEDVDLHLLQALGVLLVGFAHGSDLVRGHLPGLDHLRDAVCACALVESKGSLDARLDAVEYEMIIEALKVHHGNMTEAAKMLGLTRRILGLRLNKYNLDHKDYH